MILAHESLPIPAADTAGNGAVAEGDFRHEFVDVDRRNIRVVGAWSAVGVRYLPNHLPYFFDSHPIGGKACPGSEHQRQGRKLRIARALRAVAVLCCSTEGWPAVASAA